MSLSSHYRFLWHTNIVIDLIYYHIGRYINKEFFYRSEALFDLEYTASVEDYHWRAMDARSARKYNSAQARASESAS
jgi:hypothetical protein